MMITNLNELLAKAKVDTTKTVKRSGEFSYVDAEGKTVTEGFEVHVVCDISFAEQERIYLGDKDSDADVERMGRTICARLRFGDDLAKMTYEQASGISTSLGLALMSVINKYDAEREGKTKEDSAKA